MDRFIKDKQLRVLVTILLQLILVGMIFYHYVEKLSWLDSYYFTIIVLTTVGFGDISPETNIGKIFTTFYILIGMGVVVGFIDYAGKRHFAKKLGSDYNGGEFKPKDKTKLENMNILNKDNDNKDETK